MLKVVSRTLKRTPPRTSLGNNACLGTCVVMFDELGVLMVGYTLEEIKPRLPPGDAA